MTGSSCVCKASNCHQPFSTRNELISGDENTTLFVVCGTAASSDGSLANTIATALSPTDNHPSSVSASAEEVQTFYRRALPTDTCVALSSKAGKSRFQSALTTHGLKSFFPLMEQHSTQSEPAYCGISTLTIALNAFAVDPRRTWKGPWRWYTESMLNCCIDLSDVQKTGITIATFRCLAVCQGLSASVYYHDDQTTTSLEHFRETVKLACQDNEDDDNADNEDEDEKLNHVLVVSYDRRIVGQTGSGHFSPIAAYDEASDSVLIMDTARFKYGVHWISLPLVYEAMQPIDPDSNRSRGYILLSREEEDEEENEQQHHHLQATTTTTTTPSNGNLPVSLLLKTKMKQNPVRLKYKEFLDDFEAAAAKNINHQSSISWQDVLAYWTKNFTDYDYIWEVAQPQLIPCAEEKARATMIDQVRRLISILIPQQPTSSTNSSLQVGGCPYHQPVIPQIIVAENSRKRCRPNLQRTLPLTPEEVIFIVYLASLDEHQRKQIIFETATATVDKNGLVVGGDNLVDRVVVERNDSSASIGSSSGLSVSSSTNNDPFFSGSSLSPPILSAQLQLLAEADLIRRAIDLSKTVDLSSAGIV